MHDRARLGSTLVIKGELTAHENLVLAGRVEGSIHVTGHVVTVDEGACVIGDIRAAEIVVTGSVEGGLLADKRIHIGDGAELEGDASAPRVVIADGAVVKGRIETQARHAQLKAAS